MNDNTVRPPIFIIPLLTITAAIFAFAPHASAQTPESDQRDITIAPGGYYILGAYSTWTSDFSLDVVGRVDSGGPVDVYIMEYDQLASAYPRAVVYDGGGYLGSGVHGSNAFSAQHRSENVTGWQISLDSSDFGLSGDGEYLDTYMDVYVVVDNTANNLTASDADPSGPVDVSLTVSFDEGDYYGEYEGIDEVWPACTIATIAVVIIAVVVIVMWMRKSSRKAKEEAAFREKWLKTLGEQAHQGAYPPMYWQYPQHMQYPQYIPPYAPPAQNPYPPQGQAQPPGRK